MRDEEPLTTCSFIGVAVRVAQMLGLHKDPSHFKASVLPIPAEVHRRVWWHVFHVMTYRSHTTLVSVVRRE
jgi:hypothetical protein